MREFIVTVINRYNRVGLYMDNRLYIQISHRYVCRRVFPLSMASRNFDDDVKSLLFLDFIQHWTYLE